MNKKKLPVTLLTAALLFSAIVYGLTMLVLQHMGTFDEPQEQSTEDNRIWCYLRTIQPGESFGEVEPGNYQYAAIYTMSGIDLFERCDHGPDRN